PGARPTRTACGRGSPAASPRTASPEARPHELARELHVGAAVGLALDVRHERPQRLRLAAPEVRRGLRVLRDHLVHDLRERLLVAHLCHASAAHDLARRLTAPLRLLHDLDALVAVDGAVYDESHELGEP